MSVSQQQHTAYPARRSNSNNRHQISGQTDSATKSKRSHKPNPLTFDDKPSDRHDALMLHDNVGGAKEFDDLSAAVSVSLAALSLSPSKRTSQPTQQLLTNRCIDSSLPLPMLISRIQRTLIGLSLQLKYSLPTLSSTPLSSSSTSPPSTPSSRPSGTNVACTIHVSGSYGVRQSAVVSDIFIYRNGNGRVQSVECVCRSGCQLNSR